MAGTPRRSAEERYAQCMANAQVLHDATLRLVNEQDAPQALAVAWGADIYAAQAVLWERIMGAAAAPARRWYLAADALLRTSESPTPAGSAGSCGDALIAARASLLADCDEALSSAIAAAWSPVPELDALPVPLDLEESARVRLGGMSASAFVAHRRSEAIAQMQTAQELRVKGETAAAVQAAYESDFLSLEAYLVESAVAAGDAALQTVTIRWELATAAIQHLPGLPAGFLPGVARIRQAMCSGLSDADAVRLMASLPAV